MKIFLVDSICISQWENIYFHELMVIDGNANDFFSVHEKAMFIKDHACNETFKINFLFCSHFFFVYFWRENSCNRIDLIQQAAAISRYLLLSNQFQFVVCKRWFQFTHSSLLPFDLCVLSMILKQRLIEGFRLWLRTTWLLWIIHLNESSEEKGNENLLEANDLWKKKEKKIICFVLFFENSRLLQIALINANFKIVFQF